MAGYSNTGCLTADKSWADGWKKYGGGIGPDSRCWEGSFGTGCFETECTGNDVP